MLRLRSRVWSVRKLEEPSKCGLTAAWSPDDYGEAVVEPAILSVLPKKRGERFRGDDREKGLVVAEVFGRSLLEGVRHA